MRTAFYISKRYLFSKRNRNAVNIISFISIISFTVSTAALIIVLSVFNGFETVIDGLYNKFDPEIKVLPIKGKSFELDDTKWNQLQKIKNIQFATKVYEENALIRYNDHQTVALIKGVSNNYFKTTNITEAITAGDTNWSHFKNFTIIGSGLSYSLGGVDVVNNKSMKIMSPKTDAEIGSFDLGNESFNQIEVFPTHEFAIQKEIDGKMLIIPLNIVNQLFQSENKYTQIEISLYNNHLVNETKNELYKLLGDNFNIQNKREQHQLLNKIMNGEKTFSYVIMIFILLVGSFNLVAMIIMLILEKKDHMITLYSVGGSKQLIRKIFFNQGLMITIIGTFTGLLVGYIFCLIQEKYGVVSLGDTDTMVISSYPIDLRWADFIKVLLTTTVIGFAASYYASQKVNKTI